MVTLNFMCTILFQRMLRIFVDLSSQVYQKLERTIPGFDNVMMKVHADAAARKARRIQKREAIKKAEKERILFGRAESGA